MKVLLSWLREFAPGIEGDPADLSDTLSALGLTVEDMTVTGSLPDGVVLGRVMELRPHPDADLIQLVEVDDGSGDTLQVCCGAFNMAVGDLIPLARVGTVLPGGLEISRRRLRGQASEGMCCSEIELEMGVDADGIMILNDRIVSGAGPGTPLADALGLAPDVLWDLDVGANRPDAMSVMGVARDLAAGLGTAFEPPDWSVPASGSGVAETAQVEIVDPTLCGRFGRAGAAQHSRRRFACVAGQPAGGLGDAPDQQHRRHLQLCDARAGPAQPHLRPGPSERGPHPGAPRPRRRDAHTLDGAHRTLAAGDGVIADGDDGVIGLAGVMGGASTEIGSDTRDVLVEMAWWDPPSISRTAKRLNLASEAATRFRRGTDWGYNMQRCMNRFVQLAADRALPLRRG